MTDAPSSPTDTVDVPPTLDRAAIATLVAAFDAVETLTAAELAEALEIARLAATDISEIRATIESALVDLIEGPIVLDSGTVVAPRRQAKRVGWNKRAIRAAVTERRARRLVDPETKELIEAFPVAELGDSMDVRTGVGICKALGLEVDSVCNETWSTGLDWLEGKATAA